VGIISKLLSQLLKASPFASESLDKLAGTMQVTKLLRAGKLARYYNVGFLAAGGMAFFDKVFFDSTYLETLLPDELLAVGAHEFTHLKKRHGIKKFFRLTVPASIVGVLMGFLVFSNFESINQFPLVGSLGNLLFSLLAALFFVFFALFAGLYVNAKWLRQQETECDLSSVKFLNGEPMIPALIKLNNLRPRRMMRIERWLPKIYPTLEQRINDIKIAAENKKKQSSSVKYESLRSKT